MRDLFLQARSKKFKAFSMILLQSLAVATVAGFFILVVLCVMLVALIERIKCFFKPESCQIAKWEVVLAWLSCLILYSTILSLLLQSWVSIPEDLFHGYLFFSATIPAIFYILVVVFIVKNFGTSHFLKR